MEDRKILVLVRIGNLDRPKVSLVTSPTAAPRFKYMNTSKFDPVLGQGTFVPVDIGSDISSKARMAFLYIVRTTIVYSA